MIGLNPTQAGQMLPGAGIGGLGGLGALGGGANDPLLGLLGGQGGALGGGAGGLGTLGGALGGGLAGGLPTGGLAGGAKKQQSNNNNSLMMMFFVMALSGKLGGQRQNAPAQQTRQAAAAPAARDADRGDNADRGNADRGEAADRGREREDRRDEPRDDGFGHPDKTQWDANGNILLGRGTYEEIRRNPQNTRQIIEQELLNATAPQTAGIKGKNNYWKALSVIFRNDTKPFSHGGKKAKGYFDNVVNELANFYGNMANQDNDAARDRDRGRDDDWR